MFGRLLRKEDTEERAMQVTPWGDWGGGTYGSAAGMNVTQDSSLQLLAVYGSVQLIADTIATLPRDIYREKSPDETEEVLLKPRWFEQPNASTDIIEFITQSLYSLLLDGNAYWAYSVDLNFAPTELRVLNPTMVDVRPSESRTDPTPQYFVNGNLFTGRLLHIKGMTAPGALKGLSPIESARQSIGIGLAVQEFAGNFYKNGTTVSGVIKVPGKMTTDEARDLKQNWSRGHGGVGNAHLPGVITNGAEWQSISITPEQAQFLESRQFQAAEIAAQMFLLDPSMLGIASAGTHGQNLTYANLEQRGIHLVQFTLLRWIIRLERAFSFLLPKPQFMKFNVAALERADLKTRYEAHRIALGPNVAWETVNEVRDLEDLSPQPGADILPEPPAAAAPAPVAVPQQPIQNSFDFTLPEIRLPEHPVPIVHVAAADPAPISVNVEPAEHHITVAPTPVEMHNHVELPEQPAAVVNVTVDPTPVEIKSAPINIDVAPTPIINEISPTPVSIEPAEVNVNFTAPETRVEVNPTPIEVHPPNVTVESPNVTVEPAEITVNQASITVEPAPVTVNPTPVRIDAPQINLPPVKKIRRTFERDEQGITIAIIEEPIDEPEGSPNEDTP